MNKKIKYEVTMSPSKMRIVNEKKIVESGNRRDAEQRAKEIYAKQWGISPHHILIHNCESI